MNVALLFRYTVVYFYIMVNCHVTEIAWQLYSTRDTQAVSNSFAVLICATYYTLSGEILIIKSVAQSRQRRQNEIHLETGRPNRDMITKVVHRKAAGILQIGFMYRVSLLIISTGCLLKVFFLMCNMSLTNLQYTGSFVERITCFLW